MTGKFVKADVGVCAVVLGYRALDAEREMEVK
jgi:hypothetical protein